MSYTMTTQTAPMQPDVRGEVKFTIDELVMKAQSVSNHCCSWHPPRCSQSS